MNNTFFITGVSGFVAQALIPRLLANGARIFAYIHEHQPHFPTDTGTIYYVYSVQEVKTILAQNNETEIDAIIHLAGAGIANWPWTPHRREILQASRWDLITRLQQSFKDTNIHIGRIIGASAVGFYGDSGDAMVDEFSPQGRGFAADLCGGIERRLANAAHDIEVPWYGLRFGIVLGPDGGMLAKLALPARLGLASVMGSGQQWLSWVDREDVVEAILFLCQSSVEAGVVNVVSPHPVRWSEFMDTLAHHFGRKARITIPRALLLPLGEMKSLFLDSVRVMPSVLLKAGFEFRVTELQASFDKNLK